MGYSVMFWYICTSCNNRIKIFRLPVISNSYEFFVMRTFEIFCSMCFALQNAMLLTLVTLWVLEHQYLLFLSGCDFVNPKQFLPVSHPYPSPPTGNHFFVHQFYKLIFFFRISHMGEILWYLSFCAWLSLSFHQYCYK